MTNLTSFENFISENLTEKNHLILVAKYNVELAELKLENLVENENFNYIESRSLVRELINEIAKLNEILTIAIKG